MKHLCLYDASPYTDIRIWLTEQNFRENYLKPFEIAIKKGGANGLMASFNKIGATWAGSNDAMINGIIRTEFGFKGTVITDWSDGSNPVMDIHAGLRGGLNTQLNPNYPTNTGKYGIVDFTNPVEANLARESAKSILYTSCNTYYRAKHNIDVNEYTVDVNGPQAIKKGFEWWIPTLIALEVVIFGALGYWLYRVLRKQKFKKLENYDINNNHSTNTPAFKEKVKKAKHKNDAEMEEEIRGEIEKLKARLNELTDTISQKDEKY